MTNYPIPTFPLPQPRLSAHERKRLLARVNPVRVLNRLLRAEMAAAASYERALPQIECPTTRDVFELCRASHAERVVVLAQLVRAEGAMPSRNAGIWGAVTDAATAATVLLGEEALVELMHRGETLSSDSYLAAIEAMDTDLAQQLKTHVLRRQLQTARRISQLRATMPAAT